mmetsp:Transcript_26947/g.78576  ORF Transcript_26947/g.78576 Transcript_26947/m.78576 type:complete len:113 (+) Transcript_26947:1804-2142(+)
MVADGGDVPGREGEEIAAGTVLYKVLWEGWPPEIATWEDEDQVPCAAASQLSGAHDRSAAGLTSAAALAAGAVASKAAGTALRGGCWRLPEITPEMTRDWPRQAPLPGRPRE